MKPKFRLRYCGRSWRGPEWCIDRRVLWFFWTSHSYVYGDEATAYAELSRFVTYP